jgi:superfamily II DNA or RNA helicase
MAPFDPFVRFVRDKRDRRILKERYGGCCAGCRCPLVGQWDVDHIIPWARGGNSHISNLQPLCKFCHSLKTYMENTNRQPIRLQNWGTKETCTGPLRRGHKEGVLKATERFQLFNAGSKEHQFTSVVLPTRYGKSHLARFITLCGVHGFIREDGTESQPCISSTVFLTHRNFLSNQILDGAKWGGFADMFGIKNYQPIRMAEVNTKRITSWRDIAKDKEQFLVTTIQALSGYISAWGDWVENIRRMGMTPPLFIADEAQFFGEAEDKCWGPALTSLAEAGALIMPMTATPIRADGAHIPGFLQGDIEVEESARSSLVETFDYNPETGEPEFDEKGQLVRFGKLASYERQREIIELNAHVEVTRQEAWQHKYLCRLTEVSVPVKMTNGQYLHDLSAQQQKTNLGRVVRDPRVVKEFIDRAEALRLQQAADLLPNCGVIVFVESTTQELDHAAMLRDEIESRPGLKAIVATQETGTDANIQRFADDGIGQYLIVKKAAGAGLDCERIKISVDLSCTRTVAACEQAWNRSATPTTSKHGTPITTAYLIKPDDIHSSAIFNKIYTEQGGQETRTHEELVAEQIIRLQEREKEAPLFVEDVGEVRASDTDGRTGTADDLAEGARLLSMISDTAVGGSATPLEILLVRDRLLGSSTGEMAAPAAPVVIRTDKAADMKREVIRKMVASAAATHLKAVNDETMPVAWANVYEAYNRMLGFKKGHERLMNSERYKVASLDELNAVESAAKRVLKGGFSK